MHTEFLYKIKDKLFDELEHHAKGGELTERSLEEIDKLSHAAKNVCKLIKESEEEEYSRDGGMPIRYEGESENSYRRYSRGDDRHDGYSYRRRDSMGRYAREGGYSRGTDEMISELREIMESAPEGMRNDLHRLIRKMEQD